MKKKQIMEEKRKEEECKINIEKAWNPKRNESIFDNESRRNKAEPIRPRFSDEEVLTYN